jgi:hypothetical protein
MYAECVWKGTQVDGDKMCLAAVRTLVDGDGFTWKRLGKDIEGTEYAQR